MEISFENSARNTRSGFAHDTKVYVDYRLVHKTSCHYLNRTWEGYRFQSVMKKAIDELISEEIRSLRDEYKERTGKKRLPKDMEFTNDKIEALKLKLKEL